MRCISIQIVVLLINRAGISQLAAKKKKLRHTRNFGVFTMIYEIILQLGHFRNFRAWQDAPRHAA